MKYLHTLLFAVTLLGACDSPGSNPRALTHDATTTDKASPQEVSCGTTPTTPPASWFCWSALPDGTPNQEGGHFGHSLTCAWRDTCLACYLGDLLAVSPKSEEGVRLQWNIEANGTYVEMLLVSFTAEYMRGKGYTTNSLAPVWEDIACQFISY